jgi:hypothetical protein
VVFAVILLGAVTAALATVEEARVTAVAVITETFRTLRPVLKFKVDITARAKSEIPFFKHCLLN